MNINQLQICINSIEDLSNIDAPKIVLESFTDEIDFKKIVFAKYNAAEFFLLYDKMIVQLKYELEQGLKLLLPNTENYQNDFGTVNLSKELPLFKQYFEQKNFAALEPMLDKFIHYQIKNGFWEKTVIKASELEQKKLDAQHKLISVNLEALESNISIFNNLKNDFKNKIKSIAEIIESKSDELTRITENLSLSTKQATEISNLLGAVTNNNTEIQGIIKNVNDKVTLVETDIENYQESYGLIENKWEELEKDLNLNLKKATSNFKESKDNIDYIESKREQIEKLTGMAADGALGSKFHQREENLGSKINFWKWAIPLMTILSVLWVVVVFTSLKATFSNEWVNLGINLLKTTPAFILLGFVFKQYTKERNLEEEYAFKSAVAMTLTAYSGMLTERDTQGNDSRQKMLLDSICRLYTEPKIHSEKKGTLFSFNTKHLKESVEGLNKSVNDLKGK